MDGRPEAQGLRPKAQELTELEREIENALGIEPSPEFLARVRTRVATEPQPLRWRPAVVSGFSRTVHRLAVEPLWAVAIAGIVLAVIAPRWMREERPVATPAVADVKLPAAERVDEEHGAQPVPPGRRGSAEAPTPLRRRIPMFSKNERRALVLLVTAAAEGRVPPAPLAVVVAADAVSVPELAAIESLAIAPLPLLARIDGVQTQVEGERE
jgi:hypothetical protein